MHDLKSFREIYLPPLPNILKELNQLTFVKGEALLPLRDVDQLRALFPQTLGQPLVTAQKGEKKIGRPLRLGALFSGGQAAGGHNVISGLFDALKALHKESQLFGFLGGPSGLINGKFKEITQELLAPFRNQGGFDLLGSGRTKIETEEQLQSSLDNLQKLHLDGIIIIGGDDSNTNAAILAEYILKKGGATKVVGVPKTIDGDLKSAHLPISFGFDTACKIYSELIGNLSRDALSAGKYTHFIKLMGRSASHIALECALATQPNMALIGEEVAEQKKTLKQIAEDLAALICKRSEKGKEYSVILIPEGLIEFIPEMGILIRELNALIAATPGLQKDEVVKKLTPASATCYQTLPEEIQKQLLYDRDPHGNVSVSSIETEKLISEMVKKELEQKKKQGTYKGKFFPLHHFFGYEGRAGFPSNFDAHYCYALGQTAALLVAEGLTGYMACVQNLLKPVAEWRVAGLPLTMMMQVETRKGVAKPVIQKALVALNEKPFALFKQKRDIWALEDAYLFPGPIQFFGPAELTEALPITLKTQYE